MSDPTHTLEPISPRRLALTAVVVALSTLVVVLAAAAPPHALLDKADLLGYAVCHQIPERSFFLDGRQLPLCARCTGTFLGAMLGLTAMLMRRRGRASRLPPASVLGILVCAMGLWAFDGVNSYLTLFPGAPHLYEPRNWLRLSTGMLNGLALITLVFPVFSFTLWRDPAPKRVLNSVPELIVLLPAGAVLVVVVQAQFGALLYPVALLSSMGALLLFVLLNSMIAAIVLGREAYARTWRQALVPLAVGLAMTVLEIAALDVLRGYLTTTLGISF